MSTKVCLAAWALGYREGGGHLWVYLNWALGLRELGCEVTWLEVVSPKSSAATREAVVILKDRLRPFGLAESVAICDPTGAALPSAVADDCLDLEAAASADLLLDLHYGLSPQIVSRFRRSAALDMDPGLLQVYLVRGQIQLAPHDVYFTIGENVGQPGSGIPTAGRRWEHTPPAVALECWPVAPTPADAPFTTVSHWYMDDWMFDEDGACYCNDKRTGFAPFLELPARTTQPLELALCLAGDAQERAALEQRGWRVRESHEVTATPAAYQQYVQQSRGEFSCAKPSYVRQQTAWISDRTVCYLASGKPAVVQHTGPSRFLPDAAGLFRFRNADEAAGALATVAADYDHQCRLARALAEEYFDARKVAARILERGLG